MSDNSQNDLLAEKLRESMRASRRGYMCELRKQCIELAVGAMNAGHSAEPVALAERIFAFITSDEKEKAS